MPTANPGRRINAKTENWPKVNASRSKLQSAYWPILRQPLSFAPEPGKARPICGRDSYGKGRTPAAPEDLVASRESFASPVQ
jgi:hypothetical protein